MLAVLMLVPLLGMLLMRNEMRFADSVRGSEPALDCLRRLCAWIAVHMVTRPGLYTFVGLVVVIGLSVGYVQFEPRYRLADQVPDREQAVQASAPARCQTDRRQPDRRADPDSEGQSLYAPETLGVIAEVQRLLEKQAGVGNVWSLQTLRRWLAEKLANRTWRH